MINPKVLKAVLCCFFLFIGTKILIAQEIERRENITGFNSISISGGIDLILSQGNTEGIILKGEKDMIDKIEVIKNSSGQLTIGFKKNGDSWGNWSWSKNSSAKAYISFKLLTKLSVSGGCDVTNIGILKLKDLSVATSGGSDINLNLEVSNLNIAASGGSDVNLKGKAESFNVSASGGSDVEAFSFKADNVNVKMSGGSDGNVYAEKSITISASGASDVRYKGNAVKKGISTSGASDVTKVN